MQRHPMQFSIQIVEVYHIDIDRLIDLLVDRYLKKNLYSTSWPSTMT
jgi:hypothetical protein